MKGNTILIPPGYEPVIFCGVLRQFLSTWDIESVTKSKCKRRKKIRNKEIEQKIREYEREFGSLSNERKCELFNFRFQISQNGKIDEFSHGPLIFLELGVKPKIHFSPLCAYFPKGVLKDPDVFKILHNLKVSNATSHRGGKMSYQDILELENKFDLSCQVWKKLPDKYGIQQKIKGYTYEHVRHGNPEKTLDVHFHYDESVDTVYLIQDTNFYFKQLIRCKNFSLGCYFTFRTTDAKKMHEKNCSSDQQIHVVQKELGLNSKLFQKARDFKLLPEIIPVNRNFLVFDIESVLPPSDEIFGKSCVQNLHKVVSISANSFISGEHTTKVWVVDNSSPEAETALVGHFVKFCLSELKRVKFDQNLELSLAIVEQMLNNLRLGHKNENFDSDELSNIRQYLSTQLELSVFGYNSSRYDLPIIFNKIIEILDFENFAREKISVLKKGLSYFSINIGRLHFKDLTCFNCPMSLDRYLKIWNGEQQKLVYPYERFSSIEEIRLCKTFPPIQDFMTTLKPEVDADVYQKCKDVFDARMALPENHENKWSSFEDYLKYYNESDVLPTSKALLRQFDTYLDNFGSYPMSCLGLPSFAKECMFNLYNPESPNIFTFCDMETTNLFRNQIIGGLTAVYKRHVTLCDEEAAPAAKENKEGIINQRFHDFN